MIMSILLAIVLGVSTILVSQMKVVKGIENSIKAFYAAETGIEYVLTGRADIGTFINGCPQATPCTIGGAEYYVEIDLSCGAPNVCIRSIGSFRGVKRAIQVSY